MEVWRQKSLKAYQISSVSSPEGSPLINLPEVICCSQLQIAQTKIASHFPCAHVFLINHTINIRWIYTFTVSATKVELLLLKFNSAAHQSSEESVASIFGPGFVVS